MPTGQPCCASIPAAACLLCRLSLLCLLACLSLACARSTQPPHPSLQAKLCSACPTHSSLLNLHSAGAHLNLSPQGDAPPFMQKRRRPRRPQLHPATAPFRAQRSRGQSPPGLPPPWGWAQGAAAAQALAARAPPQKPRQQQWPVTAPLLARRRGALARVLGLLGGRMLSWRQRAGARCTARTTR